MFPSTAFPTVVPAARFLITQIIKRLICLCVSILIYTSASFAQPLYLAPIAQAGSVAEDGSYDAPFSSMALAVKALNAGAGDQLILKDGNYGAVMWRNLRAKERLHVTVETPGKVHMDSFLLRNVHNMHFTGFNIWPRSHDLKLGNLVRVKEASSYLTFENFDVRSRPDAPDTYYDWTKDEWKTTWKTGGFRLSGPHMHILNNKITAVNFGITVTGEHAVVANNVVRGFSGDGLRGLGNHGRFIGNVVVDCIKIGRNHDDAFQSWSPRKNGADSTIQDVVIEGNSFIEWAGPANHPLRGRLQGIGLFDGFFKDFKIRHNLIVVDQYHGISIYGGINSEIANNTVVHPNGKAGKYPWISVRPHKNDTPAQNVKVYNNVAMSYRSVANPLQKNVVVRFPGQLFRDPSKGDYRPNPDGPLVHNKAGITYGAIPLEEG